MLILCKFVIATCFTSILAQAAVQKCSDLPTGLEPFIIREEAPVGEEQVIRQVTNILRIKAETPTETSRKIHDCIHIYSTADALKIKITKSLSGIIDNVEFNIPQSNEATFQIECSDGKSRIGTIRIEDVNNQPPEFNKNQYEYTVNESFPIGIPLDILGKNEPIIIWDRDFPPGENNKLKFVNISNDDGSEEDIFQYQSERIKVTDEYAEYKDKALEINILNLVLDKKLDYQKKTKHQLTITASDGLNNRTVNIIVNVEDEDDKPPKFNEKFYQAVFVNKNSVEIFPEPIKAVDGDTEMNHTIVYSIADDDKPDISEYLEINEGTGEIKVKDLKTLKDKGYFLLIVKATENVYPFHFTTVPVYLRFKPKFGSSQYDAFVLNSTEVPKHIITVNAGGNFIYNLLDTDGPFTINEMTGDITLNESNAQTEYIIDVTAGFPASYKLDKYTDTTKVNVHFLGENISISTVSNIFEERINKFTIEGSVTAKHLIGKLETAKSITDVKFSFSTGNNQDSKYFELNSKTGELFTNEEFTQNKKNFYIIRVKAETNPTDQESKIDETVVAIEVTDVIQSPKFCQNQILVGITKESSFGYSFTMLTPSYTCLKGHGSIEYELTPEQKLIHIDKKSGQLYLIPHNYDELKKDKLIELNITATYSSKSSVIPLKVYFPTVEEDFVFQVPLTSESSMASNFCSFKDHLLKILKGTDIGFIRKELSEDGKKFLFHLFAVNGTEILNYGKVARLADFEAGKDFGDFSLYSAKQLQQQRDEQIAVDADSSLTAVVILAALLFVSIVLGFLIWYRHREEMQRMNSMHSKLLENEETNHIDSPEKSTASSSKEDKGILKLPYNEESSTDWFMPMVGKRDTVMNDEIVEFANHLLQLDGKITVDMFLKNDSKDHAKNNNSSKYPAESNKDSVARLTNGKSHHITSEDKQHLPDIQELDGQMLEARGMSKLDAAPDKKADNESPLPLKAIIRMPDQPLQQPRRRSVVTFNDQPEVIRVDTNEAITIASL